MIPDQIRNVVILEKLVVEQWQIDDSIGGLLFLSSVTQHNRAVLHSLIHFLLAIDEIEAPMFDALCGTAFLYH